MHTHATNIGQVKPQLQARSALQTRVPTTPPGWSTANRIMLKCDSYINDLESDIANPIMDPNRGLAYSVEKIPRKTEYACA